MTLKESSSKARGGIRRSVTVGSASTRKSVECGEEKEAQERHPCVCDAELEELVRAVTAGSQDDKREAAMKLRVHTREARAVLGLAAVPGGVESLVELLRDDNRQVVESAVACAVNVSLQPQVTDRLRSAGILQLLPRVLERGSPQAKANAAAALFCLVETDEQRMRLAKTKVIQCLVRLAHENPQATAGALSPAANGASGASGENALGRRVSLKEAHLGSGAKSLGSTSEWSPVGSCSQAGEGSEAESGVLRRTSSARKDALMALLKLGNRTAMRNLLVRAGVMELAVGFIFKGCEDVEEESAALVASLVRTQEGAEKALKCGGVSALVELVESGSALAKECATSGLHTLTFSGGVGTAMVKEKLSLPLLGLLEESGSRKTQKKARQMAVFFGADY